jgi:hypothetical protein
MVPPGERNYFLLAWVGAIFQGENVIRSQPQPLVVKNDSAFVRHIMYQSKPERTILDWVKVKYRTNDILHGLLCFA